MDKSAAERVELYGYLVEAQRRTIKDETDRLHDYAERLAQATRDLVNERQ